MKTNYFKRGMAHMLSVLMIFSTMVMGLTAFGVVKPQEAHAANLSEIQVGDTINMGVDNADFKGNSEWIVLSTFDEDSDGTADKAIVVSKYLWNTGEGNAIQFYPNFNNGNGWDGSSAKSWCDSFYSKVLKSTIVVIDTDINDEALGTKYDSCVSTGNKVFFLSAREVMTYMSGADSKKAYIHDGLEQGEASDWWLRTPSKEDSKKAAYIKTDGNMDSTYVSMKKAARPAFNLNLTDDICASKSSDGSTWTINVNNTDHDWNDGEVTTAPTTDTEGVKTYTCSVCGETKTESISKVEDTTPAITKIEFDKVEFSETETVTATLTGSNLESLTTDDIKLEMDDGYGSWMSYASWSSYISVTHGADGNSAVVKFTLNPSSAKKFRFTATKYVSSSVANNPQEFNYKEPPKKQFTKIEFDKTELQSDGGEVVATVMGENLGLASSSDFAIFDGTTNAGISVAYEAGTDGRTATARFTLPENDSDADKTYKFRVKEKVQYGWQDVWYTPEDVSGADTTITVKAVDPAAKELKEAKDAAKKALDEVDTTKYSGDEKEAVEKAIEDGKTAIDDATNTEEVAVAKKVAEDKIAEQKTDEQKVAAAEEAKEAADKAKEAADAAKKTADESKAAADEAAKTPGQAAVDAAKKAQEDAKAAREAADAAKEAAEKAAEAAEKAYGANDPKTDAAKKAAEDAAAAAEDAVKAETAASDAVTAAEKDKEEAEKKAEENNKPSDNTGSDNKPDDSTGTDNKPAGNTGTNTSANAGTDNKPADNTGANAGTNTGDNAGADTKPADENKPTDSVTDKPTETKPVTDEKAADGTAVGKGASAAAAEKAITAAKNDNDPAGSAYAALQLRSEKQAKKSITLKWNKVKGAKKYVVYGNACGKKNKMKKLKTLKKNSFNVKKIGSRKLKKGTYHKFIVVALDKNNKVVSTSKIIHVATKGGKVGNHTKITVKKTKVTLKKGKTFKLGAKQFGKKVKKHRVICYETSNSKVATVSKKGIVKGKSKGTCYVYAYTQNGLSKKVKVTVK